MTAKKKAKKITTKGIGVIAKIIEAISRPNGATADETLEILKKAFPERDPVGCARRC